MNVKLSHRNEVAITKAYILSRHVGTEFTAMTIARWMGAELGIPVDWHLVCEIANNLCALGMLKTVGLNDGNHIYRVAM